ncbi:contractile injection system tape measure protein [Halalkalibaculum sp. DA3122]|uniref:contractile injection system tape measure protein n=1 Tax=unclassified Halalkalibaculum TaxID=2964617 RepID=UPI0037547D50
MEIPREHIIDKLRVELSVQSPDRAHEIQDRVSRLVQTKLKPVLEALFQELAGDRWIVLDHLELDLETLAYPSLEDELVSRVQAKLREKLAEYTGNDLDRQAERERWKSREELYLEIFFYYMRSGRYPWFVGQGMLEGPLKDPESLFLYLLENTCEKVKKEMVEAIADPRTRKRVAIQFGDDSISKIAGFVNPMLQSATREVMELIGFLSREKIWRFSPSPESRRTVREYLLQNVVQFKRQTARMEVSQRLFASILEEMSNEHSESLASAYRKVLRRLKRRMIEGVPVRSALEQSWLGRLVLKDIATEQFRQFLVDMNTDNRVKRSAGGILYVEPAWVEELESLATEAGLNEWRGELLRNVKAAGDYRQLSSYSSLVKLKQRLRKELKLIPDAAAESEKPAQNIIASDHVSEKNAELEVRESNQLQETEEYYIANAGLVLLWPYLARFFRKLELLVDREFIDETAHVKAVHLLQFMATGSDKSYEYLMVLNKILCGYPVDRPLPSKVFLSESEKNEAVELIQSAIDHWKALKNSSVGGFREAFLKRNGRLHHEKEKWLLHVESKTYDMLIDRLPWGISVIRNHWMPKPLYVEWR